MADTQNLIPLGATLVRNPSMTRSEFSTHWLHNHAAIVTPYFLYYANVVEYTQIHLPEIADQSGSAEAREKLLLFDGVAFLARYDTPGAQDKNWLDHQYYHNVISVDERRFLYQEPPATSEQKAPSTTEKPYYDAAEWRRLALEVGGVEQTIIKDGKALVAIPEQHWQEWRGWEKAI